MSVSSIVAGEAYVKILSDNSGLEKGLSRAQTALKKFSSGAAIAMAQLAVPFSGLAKSFFVFQEFDDKMRLVKAVTGAVGAEFDMLTAKAKKLGRETRFTAGQVSEGMISLGRMGFSSKEIDASIASVMNLSTATGTELATASEIAANNMRVFGMRAEEMTDAADILTVTANGSAQNLVDLGEALKMAGPHAKNAGSDLKETCAALGILANMGIKGSLAGTALGKSFKRLADPGVQDYLQQFGIRTVDASGHLRRMRDILVEVGDVMRRMPSAQRITFAEKVFDARGSLGGGVLSQNMGGFDEFLQRLDHASGESQRIAQEMESGIGGSFRSMLSALEGVGIAVGESIAAPAKWVMKFFTDCLKSVQKWISANRVLVGTLGSVIAGVMGFALVGKVFVGVGTLVGGLIGKLRILAALVRTFTMVQVVGLLRHGMMVVAVSSQLVWSAARVAGASRLAAAGLVAQSMAANVARSALAGLTKAMTVIAAHPVMAILIATAGICLLVANRAQAAADEMQRLADASQKMSQVTGAKLEFGDNVRVSNEAAVRRLEELEAISRKMMLTAEQMAEAEKLLKQLDPFGNQNYGKLDKELGTLTLNGETKERIETDNQASARRDLLRDYEAKRKAYLASAANEETALNVWKFGFFDGGSRRAEEVEKASAARLKAYREMMEVQKRLRALDAGEKKAVYGEPKKTETKAPEETRDLVQLASKEEIDKASKAMTEAEKKIADAKRDRFEKEIEEIRRENEEYKKQAQFLLENEKKKLALAERRLKFADTAENRKAVEDAKTGIAGYEKGIAEANQSTQWRIRRAEAEREKSLKPYQDFLKEEAKKQTKREEAKTLDRLREQNPLEYMNKLSGLTAPLQEELKNLQAKYTAELSQALSDGKLNNKERGDLKEIQKAIQERQSKLNDYQERIESGRKELERESVKVQGSFSGADLSRIIGMDASSEQQKLKYLHDIAQSTKRTETNTKSGNTTYGD